MSHATRSQLPTREQWMTFALHAAGWEWDRLVAEAEEHDADALALRTHESERIRARYDLDCAAQRAREDAVSFLDDSGRDPRRTLLAIQAIRAERDASATRSQAKRLRSPPCESCGWAAGHGHAQGCDRE